MEKEYTYEEFDKLASEEVQEQFSKYFHKYSHGDQSGEDYYYGEVKYWSSLIN